MYKIIQESNLLLSLLFLIELKLFPGLKLEFLEAFFNSSQGYYYSRASLSNNKSCLELKKTSRKLHFNPGNSFRSVKNSRESNKVLLMKHYRLFIHPPKFKKVSLSLGCALSELTETEAFYFRNLKQHKLFEKLREFFLQLP